MCKRCLLTGAGGNYQELVGMHGNLEHVQQVLDEVITTNNLMYNVQGQTVS